MTDTCDEAMLVRLRPLTSSEADAQRRFGSCLLFASMTRRQAALMSLTCSRQLFASKRFVPGFSPRTTTHATFEELVEAKLDR
jgi:hypothetical protein